MVFFEIYNVMQIGVLMVVNIFFLFFVSYCIYEQVKCYMLVSDFVLWFMYQLLFMNKFVYDGLNDVQKVVLQVGVVKVEVFYLEEVKKQDVVLVDVFVENGVEIV